MQRKSRFPFIQWIILCSMVLLGLALFYLYASAGQVPGQTVPNLGGCSVFPADNIWNRPVTDRGVHPRSSDYIQSIGASTRLHADFGSGLWEGGKIGIPYNLVSGGQPKQYLDFEYASESDAGPYPIPSSPQIEYGSDHHLLIVDTDACTLYEIYRAEQLPGGGWAAGSGAIFDLHSNALRPAEWTSADAAGLPILAGLARYDEVASGRIAHALRFTVNSSQSAYVWPARHEASWNDSALLPPMGMRFRLKASFDTSGFPPQARVILNALKEFGMIVADNGSSWYITGVPDERWNNDDLHTLSLVTGDQFQAVDTQSLMVSSNSAQFLHSLGTPRAWLPLVKQ